MNLSFILLSLAFICAACAVSSAILIAVRLDQRGIRTPFPMLRLLFFRNLSQYRSITLRETGQVGSLFYLYIVAINSAWVLGLAALVIRLIS